MSNEINGTDVEWFVKQMEDKLEKEKRRLDKLQDEANKFWAFLDDEITQADNFLFSMEESLFAMKSAFVGLGYLDASVLEEDDE